MSALSGTALLVSLYHAPARHLPATTPHSYRPLVDSPRPCWLQAYGSADKQFVLLGPAGGQQEHYGHFDILMGLRAEHEVFPRLHAFLAGHDTPFSKM